MSVKRMILKPLTPHFAHEMLFVLHNVERVDTDSRIST